MYTLENDLIPASFLACFLLLAYPVPYATPSIMTVALYGVCEFSVKENNLMSVTVKDLHIRKSEKCLPFSEIFNLIKLIFTLLVTLITTTKISNKIREISGITHYN